ncbi:hypothetical protein A3D78_04750 [Candidatus Gottesmanbacteria bacterium RIFCSPHIGHO2_02_FULL_39_14]|uniref:Lactamase n=2 Tax=Candidatus Gottesmaniibacteriota TaxID=1752720 RepID=A0A1F5ZTT3_9BACT|nr:MAG: hypothetical protein A3D78_04750 [Candidatus Gottesmanbacteria bacterium RIFCSPHIGHO2_02_FULL_39_14]OGG30966.1 MAG: hypothetical protein A3I51_02260 [Candidatus Gottesmanbacteria bacterium RIFCSPLOWO2_02_FULL_38_8]
MDITHIGHASFRLRGKKATLITDPFDPDMLGLKFPKTESDIVTISHEHRDHNYKEGISGEKIIFIEGPGEYEVLGVKVIGMSTYHDDNHGLERGKNNIYRIDMDEISVVHLGDLGHKLDEKAVEILNGIDILMVPVGGIYTISPVIAALIVSQLEPSIIIPMHYLIDRMNKEKFGQLADVGLFLKEMGKEGVIPMAKLSITKDKIPVEQTVVVLE